jgi:N-methylhydantoinase A
MAVDVGGTFTDVLVMDERGGVREFKVATTPHDPSVGVLQGMEKAAHGFDRTLEDFSQDVELFIHGTTLATNALLTGRGAKVGMLTTEHFRDVVELRRGFKNIRTPMFNVFVPPYRPLVPRSLRLGVEERTLYDGQCEVPLNLTETRQALQQLQAEGVEAVAVCFLHSYTNAENEEAAVRLAHEVLDGAYVVASHDILPVWREFDRFSTTVVSAYIGPVVDRYLTTLQRRLVEARFGGTLLLVQSDGLVLSPEESKRRAVYLISSGPAAAPSGATHHGAAIGARNLISVDMGGTSFDVCMIRDGEIPTTTETWVGEERVAIKMVDVHSVGAGGGSIAWIDSLGLLRVGPKSAGADPGPACYGRGGAEPTVTDADLLLGYVPHDYFLGGEIALDQGLAHAAVAALGQRLGVDATEAANAIFHTVNALMADQIMEISTKRGHDVRDFALVGAGGAGPVHAAAIAELVGMPTVVIPRFSALFSAFGMFAMNIGRSYARSYVRRMHAVDLDVVRRLFEDMERQGRAAFASLDVAQDQVRLTRSVDLRYIGQFHEIEVLVPVGRLTSENLDRAAEDFHRRHNDLYGFTQPRRGLEFLGCRTTVAVEGAPLSVPSIDSGTTDAAHALKRSRQCFFGGRFVETPCYDGDRLLAGNGIPGPAIIEERTTTVVVPDTFACTVDPHRNYVLRRHS